MVGEEHGSLEVSPRSVFFFKDSALESVQRRKVLTSSPWQPQKLTTLFEPFFSLSVLVHGGDSVKESFSAWEGAL